MRQVYEATLAAWKTTGSGPFAWYSDTGRAGQEGDYGLWNAPDFKPELRTEAIIAANQNVDPWWTGDTRPASTFDNGKYDAGTEASDVMTGTRLEDRLYGLPGDDRLYGFAGNDLLVGGLGNDSLYGNQGADRLYGGDGRDLLFVDSADTVYDGGAGVDYIVWQDTSVAATLDVTAHSADYFYGFTGNDSVTANGATTRPEMHGGGGNDKLTGSAGVGSILLGEAGNDRLIGNSGIDHMVGGAGADIFVFGPGGGVDYVYDFKTGGADRVDFTALASLGINSLAQLTVITAYALSGWYGYGYGTGTVWLKTTDSGGGQPVAGDFIFV
jgi:Ca2+-binding RTX toxin-like protein